MLEHVPHWVGHWLRSLRAGHDKLLIAQQHLVTTDGRVALSSPAFADGARLPERFTADGEGVSPPLVWGDPPPGTAGLALIVEDADAPASQPLVHALVTNIPANDRSLAEGAITERRDMTPGGPEIGRRSFFGSGWLPPDPPTGHGTHDYVFQLFALSSPLDVGHAPDRTDLVGAMRGTVLAAGLLVGTYSRGEPSPTSVGAAALVPGAT